MASLKPTFGEKIAYALGDAAAGGIVWKIMSFAFPLFFTNVFGLTIADAAVLMLVARLFDVVTDPIMGSLADRTKSRWGTYRPWLIFGAIPFGLIFAALLYVPDFGPDGKRIYAYSVYLLMMAIYTAVNVPYGSLLGVMTDDANEKNQFSSYRMVGAYAMGFIIMILFPYFMRWLGGSEYVDLKELEPQLKAAFPQSLRNDMMLIEQDIYPVAGAVFGFIAAALTLWCGLKTKERLQPKRAEKFSFKQFKDLFKNKPWLLLTSAGLCTNFFNGFRYAAAGYMFTYCLHGEVTVWGFLISYSSLMAIGEFVCMIFGGLSPKFASIVGSKRGAFMCAAVACIIPSVLFFFIPADPAYILWIIGMVVMTSMGIGLYSPLLWSMYSDVADYATERFGASSTGLIFSSGTMAQKLGTAISGSLILILLSISGAVMIEDDFGNNTIDAASITDSVITMIWSMFSIIPAALAVLMGYIAFKFPLRK